MIWSLRIAFSILFVVIATTVTWASLDTALWAIPPAVTGDAWFRATLVDIYIAFLTFFVWVAYKESSWAARLGWLVAIVTLGSIAVTAYCLRELFRVPADATLEDVLLRRSTGPRGRST
jgi:predicted permease